jgi:type II secretory pathway component PulJ
MNRWHLSWSSRSSSDDVSTRSGFTLLEVVLTLSMSVILMVLIGGAVQFYARDMNVRDMDIRQTQLAAAILQMVEDDLRATLHTEPIDTAPLEALLASASGGQQGGEVPQEDLSAAGIESEPTDTELASESSALVNLQSGVAVLQSPGLIGNQYQIQLDLSRLPRLEEYVALLDGSTSNIDDVPSDIKTVAYFVQSPGITTGVQDQLDALEPSSASSSLGGLVRRSLDRAATVQAASTGGLSQLNQTGELLAPEVVAIEFSYWDGTTWQLQWSSDEYGELPLAVQVQLTMRVERQGAEDVTTVLADGVSNPDELRIFNHIVRLPLARPIEQTTESQSEVATGVGI